MKIEIPQINIKCDNYIDGEFIAATGKNFEIFCPYTGNSIGAGRMSSAEDLDVAISSAESAFSKWSRLTQKERCTVMFKMRELLILKTESLSHLVAAESGKTFSEARAELLKAIEVLEFATSLQNLGLEKRSLVSSGVHCEDQRIPLGIVAGITPFNFPAMVPFWMIPIALSLGNCFLWKPSEKTPLTSLRLAEAFSEAGLPKGVLNIVHGGADIVDIIIAHPKIKALGFVGSSPVAKSIYSKGAAQGKRVLCLGGAKNHMILLPDANPEMAAQGIISSFTGCAGQRCMAGSVLLAIGNSDQIIENIVGALKKFQLGKDLGAIITMESRQKLLSALETATAEGSKVLVDGRDLKTNIAAYKNGYWLGPSILTDLKIGSHSLTHELFGPILSIIQCGSLDEALALDLESPYGNATAVFTQSPNSAQKVIESSKSGMIGINVGVPVPREPYSFGGTFDSKFGHGDITGLSSIEFWTSLKKVTTKWFQPNNQNWMS